MSDILTKVRLLIQYRDDDQAAGLDLPVKAGCCTLTLPDLLSALAGSVAVRTVPKHEFTNIPPSSKELVVFVFELKCKLQVCRRNMTILQ